MIHLKNLSLHWCNPETCNHIAVSCVTVHGNSTFGPELFDVGDGKCLVSDAIRVFFTNFKRSFQAY